MSVNNSVNYPDNVEYKNLIIGGNFDTNPWQYGTTLANIATSSYSADRWLYQKSGSMAHTIAKTANAPTLNQSGIYTINSFQASVTTALPTLTAGSYTVISQRVEGLRYAPFYNQKMNLSFWVYAYRPGTYSVYLANTGYTVSCVIPFTVTTSNTWQFVSLSIPAPNVGTFNFANSIGIEVGFCLGVGTTYQTSTTNSWVEGKYFGTSSNINALQSTSDLFATTLIQLEVGDFGTKFENRPMDVELDLCKRYFQKTFSQGVTPAAGLGSYVGAVIIPGANASIATATSCDLSVVMRTAPTVTFYNPITANSSQAYNSSQLEDCTTTLVLSSAQSDNRIPITTTTPGGSKAQSVLWVQFSVQAEL